MIRAIDLFCGLGGSSWGARAAGARILAGFDQWDLAGQVYKSNLRSAKFIHGRLEHANLPRLKEQLGQVDLILASPECTNHSVAKGKVPRCEKSRSTAFQIARFAAVLQPRWIVIENVVNVRNWSRYPDLVQELQCLGYQVSEHILNAADFGVPQTRRRLFLVCDRLHQETRLIFRRTKRRAVRAILSGNDVFRYSHLRKKRRAKATLARASRAIKALGEHQAFLLVYYGTDGAGGWQTLDSPLRTVTTLDRFAHVVPTKGGHSMRMLQVPELQAAMGLPPEFKIDTGTRREKIHLLGNAVCPPVMTAIVRSLLNGSRKT